MNQSSDVEDYSYDELLQILGIKTLNPTVAEVETVSKKLIDRLTDSGKTDLVGLIERAKERLISEVPRNNNAAAIQEDWYKNEYPAQSDKVQSDKITDRKNKVDVFDGGDSMAMNPQQLGITNTHDVPIIQGVLNPNLKNIITRTAIIDSRFRQNIIPYSKNVNSVSINTNFTVELSEQLTNVVSLKMGSIQIPASWYTFDDNIGNTCFLYQQGAGTPQYFNVPPGNYNPETLNSFFQLITGNTLFIYVSNQNGLLSFYSTYVGTVKLTFYDSVSFNKCRTGCNAQMKINQNFGWYLGARPDNNNELSITMQQYIAPSTNVYPLQALPNFNGPLYFLLVVDDYNNNSTDNSLITASTTNTNPDLPSYYSTGIKNDNNTFAFGCNNENLPFMTRSSPRTLTNSQLYTANEIFNNSRQKINTKLICSSIPDVLAVIPIDGLNKLQSTNITPTGGTTTPIAYKNVQMTTPYTASGSSLSERTYFGPVNIERIQVKLLDDSGNIVNLNGNDWNFSLIAEQLYQY